MYAATTEIYTYLHTLSLHDALPISRFNQGQRHAARQSRQVSSWTFMAHRAGDLDPAVPQGQHRRAGAAAWSSGQIDRSEEPTSELQSLMRISYAVFCEKKTNTGCK